VTRLEAGAGQEAPGWPQVGRSYTGHDGPHRAGQWLLLGPGFVPLEGYSFLPMQPIALEARCLTAPLMGSRRTIPYLPSRDGSSLSCIAWRRRGGQHGFTGFRPLRAAHRFDCVPACVEEDPAAGADAALSRVAGSPLGADPNERLNSTFAPKAMASMRRPCRRTVANPAHESSSESQHTWVTQHLAD
jgi:hypothetical protein